MKGKAMKKYVAIIAVTLALSLVALTAVAFTVGARGNDVTVTEKVIYGDKSYAEGLRVITHSQYDDHLFWDTDYLVSEAPECSTDFKFYTNGKPYRGTRQYDGIRIRTDFNFEYGERLTDPSALNLLLQEFYASMPTNGRVTKIIDLADYYDYYPLSFSIDLPGVIWSGNSMFHLQSNHTGSKKIVHTAFEEFFRIPMPESLEYEFFAEKYPNSSTSLGYSRLEKYEYFIYSDGNAVYTDTACYFTLPHRDTRGITVDMSLIPGGNGIYRFNYTAGEAKSGRTGVDASSLCNAYPLSLETDVYFLRVNSEQTRLIMLTKENFDLYFSVIDVETMQELQKIKLPTPDYSSVHYYDGFIVIDQAEKLTLISKQNDGSYSLEYTVPLNPEDSELISYINVYECVMDYDGERLALASNLYNSHRNMQICGFYVAVYTESGMRYYGEYESSLDKNFQESNYSFNCHPSYHDPLTISWQ